MTQTEVARMYCCESGELLHWNTGSIFDSSSKEASADGMSKDHASYSYGS